MNIETDRETLRERITLFSLTSGGYQASRMFCSTISQLYLLSLGVSAADLFGLYAFHSITFGLFAIPIAAFSDTCSRRLVALIGMLCVALNFFIYWSLPTLIASQYADYKIPVLLLTELIYGLGRESVSNSLNSLVVEEIPKDKVAEEYPYYAHLAQSYTSILSIISGTIGTTLAYCGGYSISYLLSFCSLLATLGLYIYTAYLSRPKHLSTIKPRSIDTKGPTKKLSEICNGMMSHMGRAVSAILNSPGWGAFVMGGTILIALARWITYHFWQASMFGGRIEISPTLPLDLLIKLLLANLGMYLGQYLVNKWLTKSAPFSDDYYRRAAMIVTTGIVSAAIIGSNNFIASKCSLNYALPATIMLIAFSLLQGCVGSLVVLQSNLYAKSLEAATLTSCVSILYLAGRLAVTLSSLLLKTLGCNSTNTENFFIPSVALAGYLVLLTYWRGYWHKEVER